MGSAMNYAKGRRAMKRMSDGKAKAFAQNIIIKVGKGRYPDCFKILPYIWCPKSEEIPNDPKNVPKTCKTCQEFLKSKFYSEHFAERVHEERLKRIKEAGLPTVIES
jgi:hypothetical protein